MEQELKEQKQAAMRKEESTKTDEESLINRRMAQLEERVRFLHDRLTPVLGQNTSVETSDDRKETSPLAEKIIIIEEIIEAIHNRLEV